MLFNTFEYLIFLPVVFLVYWHVLRRSRTGQNIFLILASYVFYGWWDWRFLSLIIFSSMVDYWVGQRIGERSALQSKRRRKMYLGISIAVNIGLLGFFKYFNFFADSLAAAFQSIGYELDYPTLNIILPVGISFYTFQTMSYSLDVYFGKMRPTRDVFAFFGFVAFFPQLVAGPIERASHLLPQFEKKRAFEYSKAADGLRRILWGLFKKVFIADNVAIYANRAFSDYASLSGGEILIGIIAFSIQIYCDFSGYSDIAIGSAKLFGFDLMENFKYPYFSRSIDEFWRRWHISLSSWFRDYLYIPLGGNRKGGIRKYVNIFVTFVVSGLWHGANWTFVTWGALNGLYFIPSRERRRSVTPKLQSRGYKYVRKTKTLLRILFVNVLVLIAWVIFRAADLQQAIDIFARLFTSDWGMPQRGKIAMVYIIPLIGVEWLNKEKPYPLQSISYPAAVRYAVYALLAVMILSNLTANRTFIYFQF